MNFAKLVPSYLLTIFALTTAYPNSFPTAWQWTGGVGCMVFLLAAASIYSRLKYSFADNTDDTKTAIKVKGLSEILLLTSAVILASGLSYRAFSIVFLIGLFSLTAYYAIPKEEPRSPSIAYDSCNKYLKRNVPRLALSSAMLLSSIMLMLQ